MLILLILQSFRQQSYWIYFVLTRRPAAEPNTDAANGVTPVVTGRLRPRNCISGPWIPSSVYLTAPAGNVTSPSRI